MSNTIQNRLTALKQYVHGIRFVENFPIVDVILKENWTIPKSNTIVNAEVDKSIYHYIFTSEKEGIDEILDFVEHTVNLNLEREQKQILFKEKIKEMQEFFKKHKLTELVNMRFSLEDEKDLENDIYEEDIDNTNLKINNMTEPENKEDGEIKPIVIENTEQLKEIFDEKPIIRENMTEEEREEEEAIARAKAFRDNKEKFKLNGSKPIVKQNNNVVQQNIKSQGTCNCSDDNFCNVCIESKGF